MTNPSSRNTTGPDPEEAAKGTGRLSTKYPDRSTSPGLLLWLVTNAWQRKIRQALAPYDLTHVQFVLLATLTAADAGAQITQRELSTMAGTDPMMTSQVLRTLETKKLVTRTSHPKDGRAIILAPTAEGILLINRANQAVEQTDLEYFSPLGESVAEFTGLLEALT